MPLSTGLVIIRCAPALLSGSFCRTLSALAIILSTACRNLDTSTHPPPTKALPKPQHKHNHTTPCHPRSELDLVNPLHQSPRQTPLHAIPSAPRHRGNLMWMEASSCSSFDGMAQPQRPSREVAFAVATGLTPHRWLTSYEGGRPPLHHRVNQTLLRGPTPLPSQAQTPPVTRINFPR